MEGYWGHAGLVFAEEVANGVHRAVVVVCEALDEDSHRTTGDSLVDKMLVGLGLASACPVESLLDIVLRYALGFCAFEGNGEGLVQLGIGRAAGPGCNEDVLVHERGDHVVRSKTRRRRTLRALVYTTALAASLTAFFAFIFDHLLCPEETTSVECICRRRRRDRENIAARHSPHAGISSLALTNEILKQSQLYWLVPRIKEICSQMTLN